MAGEGEAKSYNMDFSEITKVVFNRIQKLAPDNTSKIVGCIFLKDPSEQEMLRLAFGTETTLLSKIDEARAILGILSPKKATVFSHHQSVPDAAHQQFGSFPQDCWAPHLASDQKHLRNFDFAPRTCPGSIVEEYSLLKQTHFLNLDQMDPSSTDDASFGCNLPARTSRRSPSLPEFPIKTCHYFNKGYCKHGSNCRYFHGKFLSDGYSQAFSPNLNEFSSEEHGLSRRSLEKLEMEITELLRSRGGMPVSIASLRMLYYEKYGRNLQAEGYLTESQQIGKAGFSLTKLLARLRNSIRLIDRPHGQNAIVLAEDEPRHLECRNEIREQGVIASGSHQIYLTFPSESTFTEDDVSNYFMLFGPVRDVRIPCQEKRMFGFVSFIYPQTVSEILMKRNPHYICRARVLVKPYKEKSRMVDRKDIEEIKPSMYYPSQYLDTHLKLHSMPCEFESSRVTNKQFEEQERMQIHEKQRISELTLAQNSQNQQSYFSYGVEDLKLRDPNDFPVEGRFNYALDTLKNGLSSDDINVRNTRENYNGQDSGQIELPESPFASPPPVGSSFEQSYIDSMKQRGGTAKKQ